MRESVACAREAMQEEWLRQNMPNKVLVYENLQGELRVEHNCEPGIGRYSQYYDILDNKTPGTSNLSVLLTIKTC